MCSSKTDRDSLEQYEARLMMRSVVDKFLTKAASERDRSSRSLSISRTVRQRALADRNETFTGGEACTRVCARLPSFFFLASLLSFSRNRGVNNERGIHGHKMPTRKRVECRQKCRSAAGRNRVPSLTWSEFASFFFRVYSQRYKCDLAIATRQPKKKTDGKSGIFIRKPKFCNEKVADDKCIQHQWC